MIQINQNQLKTSVCHMELNDELKGRLSFGTVLALEVLDIELWVSRCFLPLVPQDNDFATLKINLSNR